MNLPTAAQPSFNITRSSHVVLSVADLSVSRTFYTEVLGLVVTRQDSDALYLRGIEEACHHSLVLRKSNGVPACSRIGMRMFSEHDLEAAMDFFDAHGCKAEWVDVPHQGKTIHVTDPVGVPLEFCARMPVQERQITQFHRHKGGCAQRIDHYQMFTPHVPNALAFYSQMGFRLSEYIATETDELRGVFLQRKGNPHDIVFFNGKGPALHHVAFFTPESHSILKSCDVAGALGFGAQVERGPGRHGPSHAMFVYFRDPDGHRIELFNTHYQVMDIETDPVRWAHDDPNISFPWGLPPQRRWFDETTPFESIDATAPKALPNPMTLERFLSQLDE